MKAFLGGGKKSSAADGGGERSSNVGAVAAVVPDSALPYLCQVVAAAGSDGINKLVETFRTKHEGVSKRQAEIKVNEVAVKEKRPDDKYIVWHLKPDYEKFKDMTPEEAEKACMGGGKVEGVSSSGKKRKAEEGGDKEPRRFKRAFGHFVKAKRAETDALKSLLSKMWA
ncbi:hypothetical protein B484DRAFT_65129 [Ochromonadaceae sp. CCMP2298]|nr:hypothetical protein B484DRAFT_65129 [Ochromonadaceae sp. CCMP2298]